MHRFAGKCAKLRHFEVKTAYKTLTLSDAGRIDEYHIAAAVERDPARAELEHAAAAFERHGALRFRDTAERELGKLGQRKHRRTRPGKSDGTGIESLTGRELQVARLVVDRKTNPEIAAELFLSQKTVETHLRNIFRKLGVSSRVELARAVEQAERTG